MENELKLTIPPMVTISRSADKTTNLSNHVKGHDYESFKVSAFRSRQIPLSEVEKGVVAALSEELYQECVNEVEASTIAYIERIKKEAGMPAEMYGKEYSEIAEYINGFYLAESKEDVEATIKKVDSVKDKLNENQITLLRNLAIKTRVRV